MNPANSIRGTSNADLLAEAIGRRCPLALSCRVSDGWAGFYSKFLQNGGDDGLLLEYPWCDGAYVPELVGGQTVGVSFRRGPKRYVFSSTLVATRRIRFDGAELPAILVQWPGQIYELQRRLDYRAPVPPDQKVIVTARRQAQAGDPQEPAVRAELVDISAGGMSIRFPNDDFPQWEYNNTVECTFRAGERQEPYDLIGRVRHGQHARDTFRMGIQWFGLEATETGRQMLDRIIDLCSEYQQIEIQRLGLDKQS